MRMTVALWSALIVRTKTSGGFDRYVDNAINSQETTNTLKESVEGGHIDTTRASIVQSHSASESLQTDETHIKAEEQRQWQWAVAEELLPVAKDPMAESKVLEEVGRMEIWLDSVADRVKVVKEKLDEMEEEGGVILNLKDNSSWAFIFGVYASLLMGTIVKSCR